MKIYSTSPNIDSLLDYFFVFEEMWLSLYYITKHNRKDNLYDSRIQS